MPGIQSRSLTRKPEGFVEATVKKAESGGVVVSSCGSRPNLPKPASGPFKPRGVSKVGKNRCQFRQCSRLVGLEFRSLNRDRDGLIKGARSGEQF